MNAPYSRMAAIFGGFLFLAACQPNTSSLMMNGVTDTVPGSLSICSTLSFKNDTFPQGLTPLQAQAFELALNISGSFEGASGWANLSNNFDGEGLSMGLLSQNLGQGSLQPLLIQMVNQHSATLQTLLSNADLQSLQAMLTQWQQSNSPKSMREVGVLSIKDAPAGVRMDSVATNASVTWALNNLYSGSNFIPRWKTELTSLGQNTDYVSLQLAAAYDLHANAVDDVKKMGVNQVRAYLLAFDFEVQDGGFYSEDFTDYSKWISQNPGSTSDQRLNEITALRLRHVSPSFLSDVSSRKQAIINGTGDVHGVVRSLETQYCFNRKTQFP